MNFLINLYNEKQYICKHFLTYPRRRQDSSSVIETDVTVSSCFANHKCYHGEHLNHDLYSGDSNIDKPVNKLERVYFLLFF